MPAKIERMNLKEKWAGVSGFFQKNKDILKQKANDMHQKFKHGSNIPAETLDFEEEEEEEHKGGEPILPEAKELKRNENA